MLDLKQKTEFDSLSYLELSTECKSCTKCELHTTRTNVVVGHGPVPSNLMVIGEGPGEQEDLTGKPFVGRAGQMLTKIFESVGIDREKSVYIANIVKCRPPKNRDPKPEEISACNGWLVRQIQLVQPKVLILLGAPSLRTILEEKATISKVRGKWYQMDVDYMDAPLYIMPLFHPSYLLRQHSKEVGSPKSLTWNDMKEVKSALDFYTAESSKK